MSRPFEFRWVKVTDMNIWDCYNVPWIRDEREECDYVLQVRFNNGPWEYIPCGA